MRYGLLPYVGAGTEANPFRPFGSDAHPGWTAIDLRPDPTKREGRALVAYPDSVSGGDDLGDDPRAPLPLAIRTALGDRLGLNLRGESVFLDRASTEIRPPKWSIAALAVELLRDHATPDGDKSRWNALRAGHDGMMRIFLGGEQLFRAPVVQGLVIQDTFTRPDNNDISAGAPFPWSELTAEWQIVGNQLKQTNNVSPGYCRAEADLASMNHYAQADVSISTSARRGGVAVRFAAAAASFYAFAWISDSTNISTWAKYVAGVVTTLVLNTGVPFAFPASHLVKGEVSGSTLKGTIDGGFMSQITDTAISGNTRTGVYMLSGSTNSRTWDNFLAEDLPVTVPPLAAYLDRRRRVMA